MHSVGDGERQGEVREKLLCFPLSDRILMYGLEYVSVCEVSQVVLTPSPSFIYLSPLLEWESKYFWLSKRGPYKRWSLIACV